MIDNLIGTDIEKKSDIASKILGHKIFEEIIGYRIDQLVEEYSGIYTQIEKYNELRKKQGKDFEIFKDIQKSRMQTLDDEAEFYRKRIDDGQPVNNFTLEESETYLDSLVLVRKKVLKKMKEEKYFR